MNGCWPHETRTQSPVISLEGRSVQRPKPAGPPWCLWNWLSMHGHDSSLSLKVVRREKSKSLRNGNLSHFRHLIAVHTIVRSLKCWAWKMIDGGHKDGCVAIQTRYHWWLSKLVNRLWKHWCLDWRSIVWWKVWWTIRICRVLFGEENLQSYQTYLERKTWRATRPIWRGKPGELLDLFGEEILES